VTLSSSSHFQSFHHSRLPSTSFPEANPKQK
jgi:hypothetical protein